MFFEVLDQKELELPMILENFPKGLFAENKRNCSLELEEEQHIAMLSAEQQSENKERLFSKMGRLGYSFLGLQNAIQVSLFN